jgi:hypothetical protein
MASRRLFDSATIEIGQIPIIDLIQFTQSYVKVNGAYQLAVPFIKINGIYQQSNPAIKNNGIYQYS